MKILKIIAGTVQGILTYALSFILIYVIIALLGQLPVLGSIIYFPSSASWALTVMPPLAGVLLGAAAASKIGGNSLPFGFIIIFYILNIISMFAMDSFTWQEFLMSAFAIISAFLVIKESSDAQAEERL